MTTMEHPYMDTAERGICDVCDLMPQRLHHPPGWNESRQSDRIPRTPTGRELSHRLLTGEDGGSPHGGEVNDYICAIEDEASAAPPEPLDGRPGSLCQICERLARWRVVTRYDYLDGAQSLVTDLCAEHGWTFLTGLGDSVRAGDP